MCTLSRPLYDSSSQTLQIQVPSPRPRCAWGSYPAGPQRPAATGAPARSGAGVLATEPRWCSAACPIGLGGSRHPSCCTASPSAARTAHAAASQPTASRPLHTSTGSSSVPRTVWRGHAYTTGWTYSNSQRVPTESWKTCRTVGDLSASPWGKHQVELDQAAHGVHVVLKRQAELVLGVALSLEGVHHLPHGGAPAAHAAQALPQPQCHAPQSVLHKRLTLGGKQRGGRQQGPLPSQNVSRCVHPCWTRSGLT